VLEVPVGTQVLDAAAGNLLRDLAREGGARARARRSRRPRQHPLRDQRAPGAAHRDPGPKRANRAACAWCSSSSPRSGCSACRTPASRPSSRRSRRATPEDRRLSVHDARRRRSASRRSASTRLARASPDLPGLIEGASHGAGLGHRFLKHVERCRALLHLVDVSAAADVEPELALRTVAAELEASSPELFAKPRLVVATKCEDGRRRAPGG
jgi:GTP-binding protein